MESKRGRVREGGREREAEREAKRETSRNRKECVPRVKVEYTYTATGFLGFFTI